MIIIIMIMIIVCSEIQRERGGRELTAQEEKEEV